MEPTISIFNTMNHWRLHLYILDNPWKHHLILIKDLSSLLSIGKDEAKEIFHGGLELVKTQTQ